MFNRGRNEVRRSRRDVVEGALAEISGHITVPGLVTDLKSKQHMTDGVPGRDCRNETVDR